MLGWLELMDKPDTRTPRQKRIDKIKDNLFEYGVPTLIVILIGFSLYGIYRFIAG